MTGDVDADPVGSPGARHAPHSRRFPDALVEDARRVFQKRTDRKLTSEDARQILENLIGFFSILHEWDRVAAVDASTSGSSGEASDAPA